jgi:hypothetical protein
MRKKIIIVLALVLILALASIGAASAEKTTFVAHLSGDSEVPVRDSLGQGQAIFKLSDDETALEYQLIVANIDNVVASHIHIAPAGANGSVVVFFWSCCPAGGRSDGVLATGTITAANFVGPLANQSFSALLDAIQAGNAYVNVHTNDGVDPTNTGPGDFPGGEIRGQIH